MEIKTYFVYFLTNFSHTVLYVGVTNNLSRRYFEHKNKLKNSFTSKYNVNILIYYEIYDYIDLAISREKKIKSFTRKKKEEIINLKNPEWRNLYKNGKIEHI